MPQAQLYRLLKSGTGDKSRAGMMVNIWELTRDFRGF